ncbi:hypothetical protein [Pyxidicoccus xibeiensis]|uniref:hypothetical protein n=1 Tax=Pyxidicoccus xibeiensis TaxID=2906759 RepID=UPI0020A7AD56|nr:hypothetical protein [Pyxidicoccus xibeiensis]MCP3136434.1 hypothetical protein [Pyxidicoccus xibeiensis]
MRNALVLGLTLASLGASAAERWTAPYQLEDQRGRTFRVILGEKAPKDVKTRLAVMTVLGKKGLAPALLKRTEPVCVQLTEERPTCHTVGVYTQEPGTGDIGEGLTALAGRVQGQLSAPSPVVPMEPPSAGRWSSASFEVPVEERTGPHLIPADVPPRGYRWAPAGDGDAVLASSDLGPDFFSPRLRLSTCSQERQPPFTRLTCPIGGSLLYADTRLLVASFEDYASPATEWVATLRSGTEDLYLVRVGIKAQTLIGLLFRDGDRWRLLLRPADYAVLC